MTDYLALEAQFGQLTSPVPPRDPIQSCGLFDLAVGADIRDVEACLRQLATGLGDTDELGLKVLRHRAIEELARLEIKGGAGLVNAALPRATRVGSAGSAQGTAIAFPVVEPWPNPADGAELLANLAITFARYVSMPEGTVTVVVLWALYTHVHDAFGISPILAITSPEKRCGKTTLLDLLSRLVARPLSASNITPAALFRTVENCAPTLLIDEADTFVRENQELRGVLNSGHRRSAAFVIRAVGDDHVARQFSTWCAKAICAIGGLPDTLEDRSLVIALRRRRADEPVESMRAGRLVELQPLLRQMVRWAADHQEALRAADPFVPQELHDRAADNWRPLLAIADAAGGIWPGRARKAATLLAKRASSDQAPAELLLIDLARLLNVRGTDRLASSDVVAYLAKLEHRPWPEWKRGHSMTERQLAKLLSRFEIRPRTHRFGVETRRGYLLSDFDDAFARYLPSDPQQPQQAADDADSIAHSMRNVAEPVSDPPELEDAGQYPLVPDVTDTDDDQAAAAKEEAIERAAIQGEGRQ